jgi:hypothetical protein
MDRDGTTALPNPRRRSPTPTGSNLAVEGQQICRRKLPLPSQRRLLQLRRRLRLGADAVSMTDTSTRGQRLAVVLIALAARGTNRAVLITICCTVVRIQYPQSDLVRHSKMRKDCASVPTILAALTMTRVHLQIRLRKGVAIHEPPEPLLALFFLIPPWPLLCRLLLEGPPRRLRFDRRRSP